MTQTSNASQESNASQVPVQPSVLSSEVDLSMHRQFMSKFIDLYGELFEHDGFGDIKVEMKILRRGQKEVIIHCGKQYRFVMDCDNALKNESPIKALLKRDILA